MSWLCCCAQCTGACSDIPTHDFTVDTVNDELDITGHGYSDEDRVVVSSTGTLPTGLSELTYYYVIVVDADTIQLETSIGGGAVTISSTGSGTHSITDTTWIDIFMDSVNTDYSGLQFISGSPSDGTNGISKSSGDECRWAHAYLSSSNADTWTYFRQYTLPSGSGYTLESSVVVYNVTGTTSRSLLLRALSTLSESSIEAQFYARPEETPVKHRYLSVSTSDTSTEAFVDGERITLKMTENGGNYDVECIKTVSGSPTTVFSPTGEALDFSTGLWLGWGAGDGGEFSCHYVRIRD